MTHDWRQERIERFRTKIFDPKRNILETVDEFIKEHSRLLDAYAETSNDVEQTLAQAIGGYPWYKDDQLNFPGATETSGVCVGEHVPESLAMEAARIIKSQREEIERLKAAKCKHCGHGDDGDFTYSVVVDQPGVPVSARCVLSGCRDWLQTTLNANPVIPCANCGGESGYCRCSMKKS